MLNGQAGRDPADARMATPCVHGGNERRDFSLRKVSRTESYAERFSGTRRVEATCMLHRCEREAALVQSSMDDAFARLSAETWVGR